MITQNFLLVTCSSLLILVHFLGTSHANQNYPSCRASACGVIRNISNPFRLIDDPEHCGDRRYELSCENNVTSLYLNSQKYHVKAIDYERQTIRVADVSVNKNRCSFPKHSLYGRNFSLQDIYSPYSSLFQQSQLAWPINLMSCPYALQNSSLFTETSDCADGDNFLDASNSSNGRHTYMKVGHMNASDVKYMCRVDLIVLTSWNFKYLKNVSVSEIHESLLYGFELSWGSFRCRMCKGVWTCFPLEDQLFKCPDPRVKLYLQWDQIISHFRGPFGPFFIFLLIIGAILACVSFVGKFIFVFACVWGLFILSNSDWFFNSVEGTFHHLLLITGINFAARFIIGFCCLMGLLIYNFRRRHLSLFDVIEGFLQSDNKLMPIRYSYSEIKRVTRGFREKLGEGGYGSVYKGKLRSGHEVAVKVLGKPKGNGQDFMNEIATIGRIHHVNVVKLVGYCAESSKQALVFDFMPNGSLDKYILGREKMSSLNWKRKFEIAVGVARGIQYLHQGCDIQILHFDIKPHNILLDDKFIPKISDFGLAKLCSTQKNTVTLTAARGTIGYVAPELINRGIGGVSCKADVYSFGMLLMEMVGLNRDSTGNKENSSHYFPYWIYDRFDQGEDIIEVEEINENDNDGDDSAREIARKMTIVALWCIRMSPDDRPSMNKVLEMLEGGVENLQIPPQPSPLPRVAVNEDQTWSTFSTDHVSLLSHDAAHSIEIIVEDVPSLQQ